METYLPNTSKLCNIVTILFLKYSFFVYRELMLFDFRQNLDLSSWTEQSDTLRKVGRSIASFVPFVNDSKRNAVLFTLLNPINKRTGGFAGYRTETRLNLGRFKCIALRVRGQGANTGYKLILRHKGENDGRYVHYVYFFTVKHLLKNKKTKTN